MAPKTNIFDAIRRAIDHFYENTGKEPEIIYIGREGELSIKTSEEYNNWCHWNYKEDRFTVFGIELVFVNKKHHLGLGVRF